MQVKRAQYDKEKGMVKAFFSNEACVSIICSMLEHQLNANELEKQQLNWLIENDPVRYSILVLTDSVESYLEKSLLFI